MDPNYALVRCPNGHELQAERQHLHIALSCPVCGVTFTPASAGPAAPGSAFSSMQQPTSIDYAGSGRPPYVVNYPPYTIWMLSLWVIGYVLSAVNAVLTAINPDAANPATMSTNMAVGIVMIMSGCFGTVCFLVAMVMQLMWIYRIHKDAAAARGYNTVSPGLALGLSFIPVFNMIWTPMIMRKLVSFVKQNEPNEPRHDEALKTINLSLIYIIVLLLLACGSMALIARPFWELIQLSMSNPNAANTPEMQQRMREAVPVWYSLVLQALSLIGVAIYFRAVRLFENSVYPFLGAPPR